MKGKYKTALAIIIGCLFLIQAIIQEKIDIFNYLDEVVTIIMLLAFALKTIKNRKFEASEFKIVIVILAIIFVGIIGDIFNKYQIGTIPILWDAFNSFKVFITLLGSMYFFNKSIDKRKVIGYLAKFVRIIVFSAFICWIITLFKDIGMNVSEVRYGIKSYNFIFINAGMFAMYLNIYLLVLTMDLKYNSHSKKNIIFILVTIFLMLTSLRTRSFAYVAIYVYLLLKLTYFKNTKFKWYHILIGSICIVLIGYNSVKLYFGNYKTARSTFATTSVVIAKENFPIGTGFATFGTDVAYRFYSPVYYKYHMDKVFGLEPDNGGFAHDTYWPAIIGQFGLIGCVLFVLLLSMVFKMIYKKYYEYINKNEYNLLVILFLILVTCISSVATATFFHFSTVGLFFLIPLLADEKASLKK